MMLHWHHDYADSAKLQELLLKLDAVHYVDVPSIAHGPEYKTDLSQFANEAFTSNGNHVGRNHADSHNFMAYDSDQPSVDDSILPIPNDMHQRHSISIMVTMIVKDQRMMPLVLRALRWHWMKIILRKISNMRWIHIRSRIVIMSYMTMMVSPWLIATILRFSGGRME